MAGDGSPEGGVVAGAPQFLDCCDLNFTHLEKFSCDHLIQEQKNLISNILLTPILTYYIVGILTNFNIEPCRLDKRVESGLFCMN